MLHGMTTADAYAQAVSQCECGATYSSDSSGRWDSPEYLSWFAEHASCVTHPGGESASAMRMRRVAGLDYSLTKCGVAIATRRVNGTVAMNTATVCSTGKLKDTLPVRRRRWRRHEQAVVDAIGPCDLVVAEGVVPSQGQLLDRYGTLCFILDALMEREIPIATIAPRSAKKAVTGNAVADKALMANHIAKLWPDLEIANEHEADAAGLAHLGAVALGWSVTTLERHKQVKWTEWPEFGPEMRVVS